MQRVTVAYERVSSDKQDIGRQAVQRKRAQEEHPGLEMLVIQDDGVSAYKIPIFDRPGGKELVDLVMSGRVEAIYSDAQDRLSRQVPVEWLTFATLCHQNNTRIVLDGVEVQDNDGGVITGVVNALRALGESKDKSHRIKSGNEKKFLETGLHRCVFPSLGYKKIYKDDVYVALEVVPKDAKIIREVFYRLSQGDSYFSVGKFLRENNVLNGKGEYSRWMPTNVRYMVSNRVYVGEARSGNLVKPNAHPAILTEAEWRQAQRGRPAPAHPKNKTTLLAGLLRCRNCWYSLVGAFHGPRKNNSDRRHSYTCRNPECSSGATIKTELAEQYVVEKFLDWVDSLHFTPLDNEEELADQEGLKKAEDELEVWLTVKQNVDTSDWLKGYQVRQRERDNILKRIDNRYSTKTAIPHPVSLRAEWDDLSFDQKRSHLTAGIDTVFLRRMPKSKLGQTYTPENLRALTENRLLILYRGQAPPDLPKRGVGGKVGARKPFLFPDESPSSSSL